MESRGSPLGWLGCAIALNRLPVLESYSYHVDLAGLSQRAAF